VVTLQILQFPDRVFSAVFINVKSVEIHQEMRELWSKIKWHVFYRPRCSVAVVLSDITWTSVVQQWR